MGYATPNLTEETALSAGRKLALGYSPGNNVVLLPWYLGSTNTTKGYSTMVIIM